MQHEQPTPLKYQARRPPDDWWPYLRIALIGWSALSVVRFFVGLIGLGYAVRDIGLVPSVLEFLAGICFLMGSVSGFSATSSNTPLTIGVAALVVHVVVHTWLGGSVRGGSYAAAFLGGLQHVWFPVALVALKIRAFVPGEGERDEPAAGSPLHLLLAAQVPGLVGMAFLGALLSGLIDPGLYGLLALMILVGSVAASILSCALSLAFVRGPHGRLARRLAVVHLVYLIVVVVTCAVLIAMQPPRGRRGFGPS